MRLYNDYNSYLRARHGCKVYRIGLDAGFSCPNRDGAKGTNGCIYCNEDGSRSTYASPKNDVETQLRLRIKYLKEKRGAEKFIAYFQAFTNTYASPEILKTVYDQILPFSEVVGISIGTRPDAISPDKLKLISSYKNRYDVWIEYGLQSAHNKTLDSINRSHTYEDFANAVKLSKEFDIPVCAHVILGLPGETKEEMIETAKRMTELKIDGVKIHLLHVLKNSALEKLYHENKIIVMSQDEYAEIVCDFLECLPKTTVIQRLTGQGSPESHIAPSWAVNKAQTIRKIEDVLKRRGTYQGWRLEERLRAIS
jgi:radical SAM protein (TIGR01212 family)